MSDKNESSPPDAKNKTLDIPLGAYCRLPSIDAEHSNASKNTFLFEISKLKELDEMEFLKQIEKILSTTKDHEVILRTIGKYYDLHFPSKKESMLRLFQHIVSNRALLKYDHRKND